MFRWSADRRSGRCLLSPTPIWSVVRFHVDREGPRGMGRRGNARLGHGGTERRASIDGLGKSRKAGRHAEGQMDARHGRHVGTGLAVAESLAGAGANIVLHDLVAPDLAAAGIRSRFGVERSSLRRSVAARGGRRHDGRPPQPPRCDRYPGQQRGGRDSAPIEQFAPERWEEALAVNLSAPFHLIRLALPAMKQRGWGRIINMSSIYSTVPLLTASIM